MTEQKMSATCDRCGRSGFQIRHDLNFSEECVEFPIDETGPEIEVVYAERLSRFCSNACLRNNLQSRLGYHLINVPAYPPGFGPVEICASCRGIVDMTVDHICIWTSADQFPTERTSEVAEVRYVAVLCLYCSGEFSDEIKERTGQ